MSKILNSGIYKGQVRHRRYSPKSHSFTYNLFMVAIDLDEVDELKNLSRLFSTDLSGKTDPLIAPLPTPKSARWAPLRLKQSDYFPEQSDHISLKQRITDKARQLGFVGVIDKIVMVAQVRCFGLYFSPINFYFCYHSDECVTMIAEVSNTPWNQTHYYLVDVNQGVNDKVFHVSPFMAMNMKYHWHIKPPGKNMLVKIENRNSADDSDKVFDATLALKRMPITRPTLLAVLFKHPIMALQIVAGIYWQAIKLFAKRIPFVAHPKS